MPIANSMKKKRKNRVQTNQKRCSRVMPNSTWKFMIILFALLGATAKSGVAQDAVATQFGDWEMISTPSQCMLITRVASAKSGIPIVEMFLVPNNDEKTKLVAGIRVPNGVSLSDGIAFRHPNQNTAFGMSWQSCNKSTCLAVGNLTKQNVTKLEKGSHIVVGFRPLPAGRTLNVDVSLSGVTKGLRALASCSVVQ